MKVAFDTLGCKLNQAETEFLARQFAAAGYRLVSPLERADVYILNTCTVTHTADAKSRHWLRLAYRRNPDAVVVATGCYAQRVPEELARIKGVGLVVGNDEKPGLLRRLEESGYLDVPVSVPEDLAPGRHPVLRTRAFVKIQDGCGNFCAYCIVPLVRGREISLPADQVVAEVGSRLADGCREVVLTGTKVGSYGYQGVSLKSLIERILAETDVVRLRLSSLQPQEISPGLIGLWRNRRLCPHFHLALQSGSGRVLERMGRRYSVADYEAALSLIRDEMPEAAITTDVIVGFPGESDEEFEESYGLCRKLGFARIHIFAYSPRIGTEAVRFPDQIGDAVKKGRSRKMLALARESTRRFNKRFLGRTMVVLWEQESADGVWSGLTDNYIRVYTRSGEDLANQLIPARLEKNWRDGVWGEISK